MQNGHFLRKAHEQKTSYDSLNRTRYNVRQLFNSQIASNRLMTNEKHDKKELIRDGNVLDAFESNAGIINEVRYKQLNIRESDFE